MIDKMRNRRWITVSIECALCFVVCGLLTAPFALLGVITRPAAEEIWLSQSAVLAVYRTVLAFRRGDK